MFGEVVEKISNAAKAKATLVKKSKAKYLLASALAGLYVGFGILLIFTIGGILGSQGSVATKIVMGTSFGIALSLVIMAGSELFTGNNLIMTIGALRKKVTFGDAMNVWFFSYIGNFVGSILIAGLFILTGLASKESTMNFILKVTNAKMNGNFSELFFKGILCNILVCLAVFCAIKLKEETAKLIMIFWCLFAFITTGFEHSIANMTILSMGLMLPHPETISIAGMFNNLIPVTLGNFVGGSLFVGVSYWFISKED
ncbi:formate/nitrite transporter family protein [Anaeromicrobium sediminis]|uniref:Nitrite transporter NirC n=1 Tax=Anaeromicrobium sediminis TaxID=1478221 RepID=A0A267MIK9_9FIRM|nr:formate/nitrite transporter family protein [Anaeromicrobium sediminis]PAB58705.1 nitrite transporter NirC [Anaeromicrobium sediminis]